MNGIKTHIMLTNKLNSEQNWHEKNTLENCIRYFCYLKSN